MSDLRSFTEMPEGLGSHSRATSLRREMRCGPTETEPIELTIRAELTGIAEAFKEEDRDISSRSVTKASVNWSPPDWHPDQRRGENQQTPDLSALIQEVVDQSDWQEGNALVLIITSASQQTGERDAISFDRGGTHYGPMLHVETD